jgi:hypothetical protein
MAKLEVVDNKQNEYEPCESGMVEITLKEIRPMAKKEGFHDSVMLFYQDENSKVATSINSIWININEKKASGFYHMIKALGLDVEDVDDTDYFIGKKFMAIIMQIERGSRTLAQVVSFKDSSSLNKGKMKSSKIKDDDDVKEDKSESAFAVCDICTKKGVKSKMKKLGKNSYVHEDCMED